MLLERPFYPRGNLNVSWDLGSIPGLGRFPREGNGYPLQDSGLENAMDHCTVHGVTKSWTRLTTFRLFRHATEQQSPMHNSVASGTIIVLFKWHEMCLGRDETPMMLFVVAWKVKVLVTQWYPTLCNDPVDCSLPGSSVHGISQARTLEWVAIPCSRGSYPPKDRTWAFCCLAGRLFTIWATREAHCGWEELIGDLRAKKTSGICKPTQCGEIWPLRSESAPQETGQNPGSSCVLKRCQLLRGKQTHGRHAQPDRHLCRQKIITIEILRHDVPLPHNSVTVNSITQHSGLQNRLDAQQLKMTHKCVHVGVCVCGCVCLCDFSVWS